MYTGMKHLHLLMVALFIISLIIKTILLFINKDKFDSYKKKTKIPEMITTILFLITGIVMIVMKDAKFHYLIWIKIALILGAIPVTIIAFKKKYKYLALIGTFLFLMIYGIAEMAGKKAYIEKVEVAEYEAGSLKHGQALFKANCQSCHGETGDKGLGGAKNLKTSTLSDVEVKSIIMNGSGSMPPYKDLTEQEIEGLKIYIKTLRVN